MRLVLLGLLAALFAGPVCAVEPPSREATGLGALMFEGQALHPALVTRALDGKPIRHVPRAVLQTNPQHSTDVDFIRAIARSGSQGHLGSEGIRAALHARYLGGSEAGLYGLEAASAQDASRLEAVLRKVWSHNESIDRARVHKQGLLLVVAWHDGIAPEAWDALNAAVSERLSAL